MCNFRHLLQLLLALTTFMCNPALSESKLETQADLAIKSDIIEADAILALDTAMRSMLDTFVKPITNKERRAEAVYDLMFGADKFNLKYDASLAKTKTAVETVETGSGNCLSLSNVFIAMARYADLEANYLDVEVPTKWQRESDVYYQIKHVSASVKVRAGEYLGIEYKRIGSINNPVNKTRIIEDSKAYAAFFSNRGVESLMQGNTDMAIAYLKRSVELDRDNPDNWSNLGAAYWRMQQPDEAERAYLQAVKKRKADPMALNNLAILYRMTGREELAYKYTKRLQNYRMQNPYYLIDQAKKEMNTGNYAQALKYAKRAIHKHRDEHEFYFVAAQIYTHQGNTQKAMEYLKNAEKYALSTVNRDSYARKLELLDQFRSKKPL
jgi:Flp pilus assembly protein TadD